MPLPPAEAVPRRSSPADLPGPLDSSNSAICSGSRGSADDALLLLPEIGPLPKLSGAPLALSWPATGARTLLFLPLICDGLALLPLSPFLSGLGSLDDPGLAFGGWLGRSFWYMSVMMWLCRRYTKSRLMLPFGISMPFCTVKLSRRICAVSHRVSIAPSQA